MGIYEGPLVAGYRVYEGSLVRWVYMRGPWWLGTGIYEGCLSGGYMRVHW